MRVAVDFGALRTVHSGLVMGLEELEIKGHDETISCIVEVNDTQRTMSAKYFYSAPVSGANRNIQKSQNYK